MMGKRRLLGLAVGERRVVAAEVAAGHDSCVVTQAGEFVFPDGASWDEPRRLGERLGEFLRERGMTNRAVVGLPGGWLVTARHDVPPLGAEALPGVLRLAAERVFSLPPGAMVCDYASAPAEREAGEALLVGTTQERLRSVATAVRAAGLRLRAVTATTAALALACSRRFAGAVAQLSPEGVDVAVARDGQVQGLRHVPPAADGGTQAARSLEVGVQSVVAASGASVEAVEVHDGLGLNDEALDRAAERLGLHVSRADALPLTGLADAAQAGGLASGAITPAAALALAGLGRSPLPFDLTKPRLARRAERPWKRWTLRGAALLIAALVAAGAVVVDRAGRRDELADLNARLEGLAPSIEAARRVVDTVNLARGWYDRRPPFLDCLLGLTQAFPEQGSVWATSLAVREDMRGVLSGKATDERSVLAVLDALKDSGRFAEARLVYVREARGAGGGSSFAISFTYAGGE
jgi:hypothetical protein